MRLLFFTASISFGGAAKMLCFIAESLSKRNHIVCIANLKNTQNVTNYERKLDQSIVLKTINAKSRYHEFWGLMNVAKEFKPDAIISFLGFPNFYASLIGKILYVPSIISERGDPTRTSGSKRIKSQLMKMVVNQASGAVFQTEGAKDYYSKKLQKKSTIIANPIFINDEIDDVKFEDRNKTVVSVGRLDNEQKRYDIMLKAFHVFSNVYPEYRLRIYGCGIDEDKIKSWANNDPLIKDKVDFLGLTLTPMKDILNDGMFLITSDYEGISNSLLEAMAVGLPCVSTDHSPGGARLLITDHINGLLAPVGDYQGIAKALIEFADNKSLAESCGREAKKVIDRFNPETIVDCWEDYIRKVTKK